MCCVAINASCGEMGAGLCRRAVSICQGRIWHGKFYSGRNYTKTRDLCIAPSGMLVLVFLRPEWIRNICNNYYIPNPDQGENNNYCKYYESTQTVKIPKQAYRKERCINQVSSCSASQNKTSRARFAPGILRQSCGTDLRPSPH